MPTKTDTQESAQSLKRDTFVRILAADFSKNEGRWVGVNFTGEKACPLSVRGENFYPQIVESETLFVVATADEVDQQHAESLWVACSESGRAFYLLVPAGMRFAAEMLCEDLEIECVGVGEWSLTRSGNIDLRLVL